jgi:sugar phosphate isomerase/epimerase
MSARPLTDLSQLCIHTITTKPWAIETSIKKFSKAGAKGITVWRDALQGRDIKKTGDSIREEGLKLVAMARGGFFPSIDKAKRKMAIDENRSAIEEAHALGAPLIVLVCGADPLQPMEESRKQIRDGIAEILPDAKAANINLAIEPLHPMYADTRSAINTLEQANDMAEELNSRFLGVALDVYHVWWDPKLEHEIKRCGKNNHLFAFHICDWNVPTTDFLNDRGLMGKGCIPIKKIRGWVEDAGFKGFYEVEIFSEKFWKGDQDEFLERIVKAYKNNS